MSDRADLVVLLDSLELAPEVESVTELLRWATEARPDLHVHVVAAAGGADAERIAALAHLTVVEDEPTAVAARLLQRAHLRQPSRLARSTALRRALEVGPAPVLLPVSAGRLLNWLDREAEPVVVWAGGGDADAGHLDDTALPGDASRSLRRLDTPELLALPGGPDDRPDLRRRVRSRRLDQSALPPTASLLVAIAPPFDPIPSDVVLGLVWDLVGRHQDVAVLWLVAPLAPEGRSFVERHVADAGLASVVHVVDDRPHGWEWVVAADALLLPDSGPPDELERVVRIAAAERTVTVAPDADAASSALNVLGLLDHREELAPDRWHVAVAGPEILGALGLSVDAAEAEPTGAAP